MKMKRYLVFAGQTYYAQGGFSDFIRDFDDKDTAVEFGRSAEADYDWLEVIDTQPDEGDGFYNVFCFGSAHS